MDALGSTVWREPHSIVYGALTRNTRLDAGTQILSSINQAVQHEP